MGCLARSQAELAPVCIGNVRRVVYAGLLQEVVHIEAELRHISRVESGVVIFEDDANMHVILFFGAWAVLREHVVDDELVGQVLGELGPDAGRDYFERFGIGGLFCPPLGMGLRIDDMGL